MAGEFILSNAKDSQAINGPM